MAFDISRARVAGPQLITHKGIVVGHTLDGVDFNYDRSFTEVNVDRYGKMAIDLILEGSELTIKFKLAQTDWDQWNIAVPETSSFDGAGTKDRADFGADAGYSLRQDAGLLTIHPINNAATDLSEDITIYLAVSAEAVPLPLKINEQRVIEVTMKALVSEAYGTGRRLGHYGPADVS